MGTWLKNFAVHGAEPTAVRDKVAGWLERKGYEQRKRPSLLPVDKEAEPIAFVLSRGPWTVVAYNRAFEEGDRLRRELDSFPRLLELCVADSDDWGYTFFENTRATAAFFTNQVYSEPAIEVDSPNGGVEHLCAALGCSDKLGAVLKAQRKRTLFAEVPFRKFCDALSLEGATVDAGDLIGTFHHNLTPRTVAGWSVEPLWFARPEQVERSGYEPKLHTCVVRQFTPKPNEPTEFDHVPRPATFTAMRAVGWGISAVFKPLFWIIGLSHRRRLAKQLDQTREHDNPCDPAELGFPEALILPPRITAYVDGWLVNSLHRCRIKIDAPASSRFFATFGPGSVFVLPVGQTTLTCQTMPAEQLDQRFTLRTGQELISDEQLEIGPLVGRRVRTGQRMGARTFTTHEWIFERPGSAGILYVFQVHEQSEAPLTNLEHLEAVVRSFEFLPDEPTVKVASA